VRLSTDLDVEEDRYRPRKPTIATPGRNAGALEDAENMINSTRELLSVEVHSTMK
jgi:hypothetical protein